MRHPRRRLAVRFVLGVLCFVGVIGPWPADRGSYKDRASFRTTTRRLEQLPVLHHHGPFRVGVAQTLLPGLSSSPLAGFLDQIAQPAEGADSACSVQALTIALDRSSVTIVAVDLLLINDELKRAVLARTALSPSEVYFTATHTHCAPGGWGNHPLERLVAGTYDAEQFAALAATLGDTILQSRSRLQRAEVAFVQADCPDLQRNRILLGQPTNDLISAWIFRGIEHGDQPPPTLATLVVFGAHATISHPKPPRSGGDYPVAFSAALRRLVDPGVVLFAAGTVGDSSPVRPAAPTQRQSVLAYGKALATRLARTFESARYADAIDFANLNLEVDLPPIQVPFGSASLRLSPAATWWVGTCRANLHALQLGPAILIGFPGDLAGHLAANLHADTPVVATSFNGDYKGYLVSRSTFESTPCYETRAMSFFGPDSGELLLNFAQRSLDLLRTKPPSRQ